MNHTATLGAALDLARKRGLEASIKVAPDSLTTAYQATFTIEGMRAIPAWGMNFEQALNSLAHALVEEGYPRAD